MKPALTLEMIYESEFRFVWRNLRRLGVREADIADAAQEVFLVVYRRLSDFDQRCKVSTWLYRICFNVASDRRRLAHARHEIACDTAGPEFNLSSEPNQQDELALFDQLLEGMELEQRATFVLFEVEGYTGKEIADMLNCPLPTVYSRLRLARDAFSRAARRYRLTCARNLREVAP